MVKKKKFSNEHCKRLSESHKGQVAWNKGLKWPQKVKDKISKSKKGQKYSEQARINIANGHCGLKHSEETKKKLSLMKMGDKNPSHIAKLKRLEKKRKEEQEIKNQIFKIISSKSFYNSINNLCDKLKEAEKIKEGKIKENRHNGNLKAWANMNPDTRKKRIEHWMYSTPRKNKNTKIELKVQKQLKELGIKFTTQKIIKDKIKNKTYYVDIYIPKMKLYIECNGSYWHNFFKRKERDKQLKSFCKKNKIKLLVLSDKQINKKSFDITRWIYE